MTITDNNVIKWLKAIGSFHLYEMIEYITDAEIEGRSDIQVFADELSYCISNYNEEGHMWHEDLQQARELMRETKNGKVIPLDHRTLKPKNGYWPSEITIAKDIILEYKRMLSRYNKLRQMGIYGKWY